MTELYFMDFHSLSRTWPDCTSSFGDATKSDTHNLLVIIYALNHITPISPIEDDSPHVLQKNIGLFSFLSQLAQEGYSSEEDSTRKRSNESVGGTEWPSRRDVTFLKTRKLG